MGLDRCHPVAAARRTFRSQAIRHVRGLDHAIDDQLDEHVELVGHHESVDLHDNRRIAVTEARVNHVPERMIDLIQVDL